MTEDKIPSAIVLGSVHMDLIATAKRLPVTVNPLSGKASPHRPAARLETRPVNWSNVEPTLSF